MKIRYIAHSCFLFTSDTGIKLLIDPCDKSISGDYHNIAADAVLISHSHPDHSDCSMVYGATEVVSSAGRHNARGIAVEGFMGDHGTLDGKWLGMVLCYKFEMDGLNCLHLSDLGVPLTDAEIAEIGPVDVLFIPVGGHWTIGPDEARIIMEKIKPAVTIPMHFETAGIDRTQYPLRPVTDFISDEDKVKNIRTGETEINLELLPKGREIWVMTRW